MTHQSEVSHPKHIELDFPEGYLKEEIETNFPYQEEGIEQDYSGPMEKHYRDIPELRQHIKTNKVVYTFYQNKKKINKILKLIEGKVLLAY